jgi:hypothetical protein
MRARADPTPVPDTVDAFGDRMIARPDLALADVRTLLDDVYDSPPDRNRGRAA